MGCNILLACLLMHYRFAGFGFLLDPFWRAFWPCELVVFFFAPTQLCIGEKFSMTLSKIYDYWHQKLRFFFCGYSYKLFMITYYFYHQMLANNVTIYAFFIRFWSALGHHKKYNSPPITRHVLLTTGDEIPQAINTAQDGRCVWSNTFFRWTDFFLIELKVMWHFVLLLNSPASCKRLSFLVFPPSEYS